MISIPRTSFQPSQSFKRTLAMDTTLIKLFLYISKLIHLQNPLLLLTEKDTIPRSFCSGISFPVTCTLYQADEIKSLSRLVQTPSKMVMEYSPIFVTEANHKDLLREASSKPR